MSTAISTQRTAVVQKNRYLRTGLFSRQRVVNFFKIICPMALLLAFFPEMAIAAGKDLLADGDAAVKATAGSGSTMYKWIILGEVLAGLVLYVLTHSFKFLFGFIILSIIGNVGMKVAGY